MSLSMPSYFLGVGTVVGALTLGFGGGVLLTKTAVKDSPAAPSKLERVVRAEPISPQVTQVTEAKAVPVPRGDPSLALQAAVEPVPQVQATPAPAQPAQVQAAMEPPKPVAALPRDEPARAVEPATRADAPKLAEQNAEQRKADRKIERQKRYAERKARAVAYSARARPRPLEEQDQAARTARPQLAFEREESRVSLFGGLFDTAPLDSRE